MSGTCRNSDRFPYLKSLGITPYIFDKDLPLENIWDMDSVTHILSSVPPDADGDCILSQHIDDLRKIKNLQWVGYLSTTGVYGDTKGGWVDENSPLNPPNDRSRYRMEAEQEWLDSGLPVHIFRLSGIYGVGRSSIDSLKDGTARRIEKQNQFFSRIHVDDIVQILQASIEKPNPGSVYNCADDLPSSQEEVVAYAAELIGVEPPPLVPFEKAELSDMARSFYQSSRKVKNYKIKNELGVELKYKDYKDGYRSLVADS